MSFSIICDQQAAATFRTVAGLKMLACVQAVVEIQCLLHLDCTEKHNFYFKYYLITASLFKNQLIPVQIITIYIISL